MSRKRVHPDDIQACKERYNNALKVNNIVKQAAYELEVDLEHLYNTIVWPLESPEHDYPSAHDAFMISLERPDEVFDKLGLD